MLLLGCDFTSAPSRRKPITMAVGRRVGHGVVLGELLAFETLSTWQQGLNQVATDRGAQAWVGGFDLPFGLPRELVEHLGWPTDWAACMRHYASLSRDDIRQTFAAFCAARPVGGKFAHRQTDIPAGSSPSMKWVNPPVAFMLHAGVPALLQAGVSLPRLHQGDPDKVALEAYPGHVARSVLGNTSYKSDDKAKQTPERLIARKDLLEALEQGRAPLLQQAGLRLRLTHAQRDSLVADASGDRLDAVLCLLQAAWAHEQHEAGHVCWGLPECDPLEGWIVGV